MRESITGFFDASSLLAASGDIDPPAGGAHRLHRRVERVEAPLSNGHRLSIASLRRDGSRCFAPEANPHDSIGTEDEERGE
jgi:hypothetical protein